MKKRYRGPFSVKATTSFTKESFLSTIMRKKKREVKRVLNVKCSDELRQMKDDLENNPHRLSSKIHLSMSPIVIQAIKEILENREGVIKVTPLT